MVEVVIMEVVLLIDMNSVVVRDGMGWLYVFCFIFVGSRMIIIYSVYKGFYRYIEFGCYSNMIRYGFVIGI